MRATDKPFKIDKMQVYEAYKAVKSNAGAAGVDGQTIEQFEADLKSNLYKIWNRMSSGSYFPPPVRAVTIPKKTGGDRILGVPTVADRVAQMVVKRVIEPNLDPGISGRLLRLQAVKVGAGCSGSHARAVLEIRLGRRI
jgi:RNA-directed DNA polymerase